MMRHSWIDKEDKAALTWQCALAGVSRITVYARQKPKPIVECDEQLLRLIDEEYTRHPFYGSRKVVAASAGPVRRYASSVGASTSAWPWCWCHSDAPRSLRRRCN